MVEQPTQCPYCRYTVIINLKWAEKNGRVFCGTCCKSFEIHVGEEEPELPVNKGTTIQSALEELQKQVDEKTLKELEIELDKAVEEMIPDTDDYSWF